MAGEVHATFMHTANVREEPDDALLSQLPDHDGEGPFGAAPWTTPDRAAPVATDERLLHPNNARDRLGVDAMHFESAQELGYTHHARIHVPPREDG